jgi:PPK2 family polyphosphate:nucleotide phosphotransferase
MNFTKKLIVEPGSKVRLKHVDPAYHGRHENEQEASRELAESKAKLGELQRKLYGDNRHALLIVLQGLDAAGKDGVCWHVMSAMDPQGCRVQGFKAPTAEERAHDFLWRIHPHAPGKGEVAVFNRSHYEDVLVTRVHNLVPRKVWERRYDLINDWERLLRLENDTTILKFCLVVSKEEQLRRFEQRLDDPHRQWKISESDYKEREFFDDYCAAFEEALERTSTKHAPWFIVPCDNKWFRNLAVGEIVREAMEAMDLKYPEPTVDLDQIRSEYHAAVQEAEGKGGKRKRVTNAAVAKPGRVAVAGKPA